MDSALATISQLKARIAQLERDLAAATEKAAEAKRTTAEFLANVSHEIRTPMNGVMGMLQLAMDTDMTAAQRDYSQTALASAESLLAIINDVLDFSRIDAGRLELHPGDFPLHERVADVISTIAHRGEEKGLRVGLTITPDVPVRVHGDLGRLRQVIVNLMGNAIKFTEQGEVQLTVSVEPSSPGDHLVHFAVRDTGIGIAPEKRDLIFEAFRQADGSTTRQFGGMGLGLTISAALVTRMSGRIWVESTLGEGSTFHFTVRLDPPKTPAPAIDGSRVARQSTPTHVDVIRQPDVAPAQVLPDHAAERVMPGSLRVLLADDNPVNQKLVTSLLAREGHAVTQAPDGEVAVDLAIQSDFDVILMDVQMPRLSGIEATQQIRQWEQRVGGHVPIIALTARSLDGDRDDCFDAGMDGFLAKPVRAEDLYSTISELAGRTTPISNAQARENDVIDEVYDEAELLGTVQGDRSLVQELGRLFLEDAPKQLAAIRGAIGRRDAPAVKFSAHALKGSAGTLTARRVYQAARELELAAGGGDLSNATQQLSDIEGAFAELQARLASH